MTIRGENDSGDVRSWLTVREAADYTGYTAGYIRQLISEGKLRSVMRGYQHFIKREDADRLRQRR